MKNLLLVGLLLGSFAFGQTIVTKKGSYCTGITSIGGDHGSGAGEFFRFYKVCNINGKEYNDVALGYTWGRSDNVAPYKFFNKKFYFSIKLLPSISAGFSNPKSSNIVGAISANFPPFLNLASFMSFEMKMNGTGFTV